MMKLKLSFQALLLMAAVLLASSCKKESKEPAEALSADDEFLTEEYMLADLDDMESPVLEENAETGEMHIKYEHRHIAPCHRPHAEKCRKTEQPDPNSLGAVLHRMHLGPAQRSAVRGYMRDHCDCIRDNHAQIRKIHQAILEKAGQKRKELLAAHKEGKISAEQLREGLAGLHKRVHEEMRNNPQKRQNLKDLRICREELHRNIASVLNERQLRLWREWLQGKK